MAIDKNSKAYQNLLNSGYSDQQITDMYNQASSWQSRQEVVANTKPVNTPTTEQPTQQTTPTEQPTVNNQPTPEVKQETTVKQQETAGTTVPEIKQEWELKPLSQDYYNQTWDDAQSKIISNLNNYRQTNPEYFRDYESFKKNFSYDARNDEQKQTLDSWYGGYQKWMELAWIPVTDLYTQYKDGQVSMNELENLRVYDPTKYAELQNQINKWNIIAAYDDDKWVDTTWMNLQDMAYNMAVQTFNKFMSGDSSSGASQYFRDYESKMESPEMLALSDQCTEVQEQMENIQSDLDSIKKQVEAEYAGTWATRSKINAIIADRSYDLQLQLRTLNSEYTKYATQYNNRMNQYQNEFQMQLQEYQLNQDARNQQMKELWFAMDLMNFETNEQKAQREWDYWVKQQEYTNWNINSKDYDTRYKAALKSVQNLLSQYEGIPMQRSAEQMAQDILKAIDGWSDLGTELTKINKQIQGKPEYKYLYNQTYKPATSSGFDLQTFKIGDTEYALYNWEMLTSDEFNAKYWGKAQGATWAAKPYDIVSADKLMITDASWHTVSDTLWSFISSTMNQAWKTWGWCGAYVNKYLKSIWVTNSNYYDDELSTKLNSVNTQIPKVWSVAVYDYWHITKETWKNHWHVWIVVAVHEDGTYDVMDSNFGSDRKIQLRKNLNPQSSNCKWFFDPSMPPAWTSTEDTGTNTKQQTSADRLTLTALRNGQIVNSKVPETINQLVDAWFSEEEINEALNQNMEYYLPDDQRAEKNAILNSFRWNEIVKNFQSSTEQLLWLSAAVEQENWAWDLASIYMFMRAQDPKSVVREWEFEMAAQTMWLGWQVETWFTKLANWQRLTPEQRQNFIDVTVKVLEAKKQAYKLVYDDAVAQMKAASIPSVYYPRDWATEIDGIIAKIKGTTPQTTNQSTYQSTQSTNRTPSWATKYQNNSSTGGWSTVTVNWNTYPSDFYSNN